MSRSGYSDDCDHWTLIRWRVVREWVAKQIGEKKV